MLKQGGWELSGSRFSPVLQRHYAGVDKRVLDGSRWWPLGGGAAAAGERHQAQRENEGDGRRAHPSPKQLHSFTSPRQGNPPPFNTVTALVCLCRLFQPKSTKFRLNGRSCGVGDFSSMLA